MITIEELKAYIFNEIYTRLGEVSLEGIFFSYEDVYNFDGMYISAQDQEYSIVYTEKGKERERISVKDKDEVLWYVLDSVSFNIAMEYAAKNREEGKDFRRVYFKKILEIYNLFGESFCSKKEKEIQRILKENPYND